MAENKGNRDKVKHYKNSKLLTVNQRVTGSSPVEGASTEQCLSREILKGIFLYGLNMV